MNITRYIKVRIEYFLLGLRDKVGIPFRPEQEIEKLDIKPGQTILDFGCGIGSWTLPAAKLVGKKGKIYALDKMSLALTKIKQRAQKEELHNIDTIDSIAILPEESIDVILLYGVLPEIEDRESLLRELHRVLKPSGYLSTRYCFRMKETRVLEVMRTGGLFCLKEQKSHILNFKRSS